MPRPVQYTEEQMKELIMIKETKGIPIKKQCLAKGYPYVSINRAFKRYGLHIPRKFAEVKKAQVKETVPA